MLARHWGGPVRVLLAAAAPGISRPKTWADAGLGEAGYQLSDAQAKEIREMRLNRLTGLEQEKLSDEYKELLVEIVQLIEILVDPDKLLNVIRQELSALREEFGDARRTVILRSQEDLDVLDLIEPEDVVVTLSHAGYAKRQPVSIYRAQKRGGKAVATAVKEEDFVSQVWIVDTHDTLLTFTSAGRVYWLKVHRIPDAGPNSRGKPIVNLLPLEPEERVQAVLPVREYSVDRHVFFATRNGTVKKTPLTEFAFQLQKGKIAIGLDEGDALVDVKLTDGQRDVMLFASNGKAVRFDESEVRSMGRTATGVRGIRLAPSEQVVSLIIAEGEGDVLTTTARGYGKRTPLAEYPKKGRGRASSRSSVRRETALVAALQIDAAHDADLEPGHARAYARVRSRVSAQHAGAPDPVAARRSWSASSASRFGGEGNGDVTTADRIVRQTRWPDAHSND
jgi:DNA gyrase subunit A